LEKSLVNTADGLGEDAVPYRNLVDPIVRSWPDIANSVLGPLRIPKHPFLLASFGLKALQSAEAISKKFSSEKAKGLWAGMAAHSIMPLTNMATAAIGLVLMSAGHIRGWPVPKGGSQRIADALASY